LFKQFLKTTAKNADTLYILGDFFNVWVGDDALTDLHRDIAAVLKTLSNAGTHIYFMVGNRDFLVGQHYLTTCGATLIEDPTVVTLHTHKLVLTHADALCLDDIHYQRYRKIVRNRLVQWLFLRLPLKTRDKIATKLRHQSRENQGYADVDAGAVNALMKAHSGADLIHGHTHEGKTHLHDRFKRIVLSDWHDTGSYVLIDEKQCVLKHYNGE
jgi:UDP-2,3-diacylglucosamine hydrolase